MSSKFSNFKDPIGLIKRMITSGNQAALAALKREALLLMVSPLDQLLGLFEKKAIQTLVPSVQPILLIVGPPRSGSTLVYQTLAHYLPVSYFRNLSALFPHAPIVVERLTQGFYPQSAFNARNFYGNTIGLTDPNDGFYIWNRWLGRDRYRIPQAISAEAKTDMRKFFAAWSAVSNKPFLNKNNRNTAAIQLINDTLTSVFWIIVERDPIYVAQSLLIAREMVQGDRRQGWGLSSQDSESSTQSPFEEVVEQVYQIQSNILRQTRTLRPDQYIKIRYEDFCSHPNYFVQTIYSRIWNSDFSPFVSSREIKPFKCLNEMQLPEQDFNQLKRLLDQKLSTLI